MISIEAALSLIEQNVNPLDTVQRALLDLPGHCLALPILSDIDSPPHDKSMMDGFAIRCDDFEGPDSEFEVIETVTAGGVPTRALQPNQATEIMTGAPIPEHADAVVMVEQAQAIQVGDVRKVRLTAALVQPEQNVLRRGTNFEKGDPIFAAGHLVRATDVGLLAEIGVSSATVVRRPTVAVLATGDELVAVDRVPAAGQIRNSNSPMLAAVAGAMGLEVDVLPVGSDDPEQLAAGIARGLQSDVLILSGGVSAGTKDLVPQVLDQLGVTQVFHKVAVKPGKPIWFGVREPGLSEQSRALVFGLPGNPVSSLVGFRVFVRPALNGLMGGNFQDDGGVKVKLGYEHFVRGNRVTYWPARWEVDNLGERVVAPLAWKGSSDLRPLGDADGVARFEVQDQPYAAGDSVMFYPF